MFEGGYGPVILVSWFVCGLIAAAIAAEKDRSFAGWFLLGLLFGPLAILFIAVASRGTPTTAEAPIPSISTADEIERLAVLRDRGDLTPEEFDAAKARVIS